MGGFETTYLPAHDRDVAETTEHDVRWRDDLALLRRHGVSRLRQAVRWHRIEAEPGRFDWRQTDEIFGHLHDQGFRPIVDLVHHTSYPRWLERGFADPRFGPAYLRFAEAVATRYPWVPEYTLFNEPFSTLFLSGHEAIWPPYHKGTPGFVGLIRNVLPAVAEASRMFTALLPTARHVFVDTCERHYARDAGAHDYAVMANDRRFFVLDLFLGRVSADCAFLPFVIRAGGADLLGMSPGHLDVLGLDYYAHCQWDFHRGGGEVPAVAPIPLSQQIIEYWRRYGVPCMLSETNIRGFASDRASWLKYTLEQCEIARAGGVPLDGHCWFPFVDSADWDSLLFRCEGNIDPVGVHWLDEDLHRRPSSMSRSYAAAAAGVPAAELPAYRFHEPVATWLAGYLPHMSHWSWRDPPPEETSSAQASPDARFELRIVMQPDLLVFSHLRWTWVWQRPQHIVSRMGRHHRVWFVEEPFPSDVTEPCPRIERDATGITRLWLDVPDEGRHVGFADEHLERYADVLHQLLDPSPHRVVWLYSPLPIDVAAALEPAVLAYDVMDDLASFMNAPEQLGLRHRRALRRADVVFAGGRTLHRAVVRQRPDAHLFPSGVEPQHYERARAHRRPRTRPVAGYVGVIDERLDLPLIAELAALLPEWDIEIIGPVAKIDELSLPVAPNLRYPGAQPYDRLPEVMGGIDVALMPFALNEATRSISPTKTLEYLAAGLPVVSTPIADVVSEFGTVVEIRDDASGFAAACRELVDPHRGRRDRELRPLLWEHHWDTIARRMAAILAAVPADREADEQRDVSA